MLIGPAMLLITKDDFAERRDVVENKGILLESPIVIERIAG